MKYYASICAIAKDEVTIRDWLYYHFSIGFEHATIYDNESAIPLTTVLRDFIEAGLVDVEVCTNEYRPQLRVYSQFIQKQGRSTKWAAMIDIDEYIVPKSTHDIRDYLSDYEDYAAVAASWLVFGSNGHDKRPEQPVPLAFPNRLHQSMVVKSIIQPEYTLPFVINPHYFYYPPGKYCVNEDRFPVYGSHSYHTADTIQINHYEFMSREDYQAKVRRGYADQIKHAPNKKVAKMETFEAQWNDKGTPDSAIIPRLDRFLTFRSLDTQELATNVLSQCACPLQQYVDELRSLILAKRMQLALAHFTTAIRYYPLSSELYPMGILVYLANDTPELAKKFMHETIVRSMEQSKDKNENFIRIDTILESYELFASYCPQDLYPEKLENFLTWMQTQQRRFENFESSMFDQGFWIDEARRYSAQDAAPRIAPHMPASENDDDTSA